MGLVIPIGIDKPESSFAVKPGVTLAPVTHHHLLILTLLACLDPQAYGITPPWVVTSGYDNHPLNTAHGLGRALDFRVHGITAKRALLLVSDLHSLVARTTIDPGSIWIKVEDIGTPNEHLRVGFRLGMTTRAVLAGRDYLDTSVNGKGRQ